MISVSQATETILAKEPFLQELVGEGLINLSALAEKLLPDVEKFLLKPVKKGAVVMALKRLAPRLEMHQNQQIRLLTKASGEITVRSQLIDFTFENSQTINRCHQDLIKEVFDRNDIFYTYSRGVRETTLILSSTMEEVAEDIFKDEVLIDKSQNLSSLTIKLPKTNKTQAGLYYYILRNIAWAGINIVEVISTTNEFTLVVGDENIDKAFSVIKNL